MATARETSYLGKMRLLLLLLVLGTPCVVAQEDKSKLRTWTSSIGTKIEAELVSSTGEQVTLKTKAGRTLQVPLNKLSKADQEFLAAKSSPKEPVKGEMPVDLNWKYYIEGDAVTITGCNAGASGKLVIPATIRGKPVTSIEDYAFGNSTSLTSITIPDSVTSIGMASFIDCTSLKSVTIGNSVTSIGTMPFSGCTGMTSITIGDSVTRIGTNAFDHCTSLTSITIPDSVTSIGDGAFWATGLTAITIPDSVTRIGDAPFLSCKSLTKVTFLGDAPKAGRQVFKGSTPTIYRNPEAKGWGETWGGRPVKLINEKP